MDEEASLDALATLLTNLSQSPYDVSLHAQHVALAQTLESFDPSQSTAAREMFIAHYPAGEEVWLPLIQTKESSVDLTTAEGCLELLELYGKAEEDYLCECQNSWSLLNLYRELTRRSNSYHDTREAR